MMRKLKSKQTRRRNLFPYLLILPFLVLLVIFRLVPVLVTLFRSFYNFQNGTYIYLAFSNFSRMFHDQLLLKSLFNTAVIFVLYLVIKIPALILISYWIAWLKKPKRVYLSILYLPTLIGTFAFAIIYRYLFTYDGLINDVLFRLFKLKINWLGVGFNAKVVLALAMSWGGFGLSVLLLANAFNSVPQEVLESAAIDGASNMQKLVKIMLPYSRKVLGFIVLSGFIATLNLLDLPFNLTQGAPNNATVTLGFYIYKVAFSYNDFSYAATIGITLFIVAFIIYSLFRKVVREYAQNI